VKFKTGQKVEITKGVLKGEKATIENCPGLNSHIQEIESGWTEVWIRFEKDGAYLPEKGRAILRPRWIDVDEIKIVR
jgi:hypothetical protein